MEQQFSDWTSVQTYALAALSESDRTVLRCYEKSVPVPAAWSKYRDELRDIVRSTTGDPTLPLPVRPPYPTF